MAALKLLVAWIVISFAILRVRSDGRIDDHVAPDPVIRSELEALRSKISALESSIEDGIQEIKIKEGIIAKLEIVIHEKSEKLELLQSEIESFQKKDGAGAAKLAGKAKLENDVGAQSKRSDTSESQASEAEKKVEELNLKLETVNGAWLPPWLVIHITHFQDLAVTHWNGHVKPALTFVLQKASEKTEQVEKWAGPHLDAAKHMLMPAVKEQLVIIQTNAGPYLQQIYSKTVEVHEASMKAVTPYVVKVQELADPYLQEVKRISKPYIDQVVTVINPHLQKVQIVLRPYNKIVVRAYRSFLKTLRTYHTQVQDNIHEKLKNHELTKPHATKELAWFIASASLAFPVFFLYRILVENFCKKAKKPRRKAHASQAPRRHKRRHAEK